ncbi:amino acid adenylation domain-containing protein [Gelidibacter algens]|uniref:Amino acid adenylation domain-containing protein n=1 Tax=Gelidibacter algens TaxID=49280 RepID=A0A1A7R2B0_9FLAO|nr:type I polyketide synthase [Gelidibacter algens]OBX24917.1 type I polyketide synthase [Gelidibacter algens]RAJ24746.1 amino acid adenylation domain-containing protein [Gelidibacter algens]
MHNPNNVYLLFEKAARSYPDGLCILTETDQLTYRQTEEEILKVYNTILGHARNEEIIGVPTSRCIDQIIFVLSVLKAGKAYLPIDFGYPEKRLESIIGNSKLSFCLTTHKDETNVLSIGLKPLIVSNIDQPVDHAIIESNTKNLSTYILYTSGSTGEPKGVCMGEKAMVNLITWQNNNSTSKIGSRTLQFAPLTFDVSFQEIMATLSNGGTLVLINDALRLDMVALLNYIDKQQVNRLFLPFVALQALAEAASSIGLFPMSLKEVMTAGEQLKITPQVSNFFSKISDCVLYNQYGPTECHVVTELKLDGNPANWPTLPTIGKPISNTSILILNKNQELVPDGTIGELYIAGDCMAEGYLNNKELTDEKFINWNSPDGKNTRIYRTGDIAQYLPDGNIEFLGREDDQVKISGHRIELAEIELAINSVSGIEQTVVIASNHLAGQTRLVAYIQPSEKTLDVAEIRQKVSNILPEYMMPSYFTLIEEFPRTSSGKIDKKKLPAPQYSRPSSAPPYKAATTEIQKHIAKVWADLLSIPKIGIDDNFFELGGTSLLAQKVVAILLKDYNYSLPVTKLYQFPRIAEISKYLDPNKSTKTKKTIKKGPVDGTSKDVAVIGMAGRFPGANTIQELWDVLKEGRETISFFTKEELDKTIPDGLRNDPLYVRARGIIPSAQQFDAGFFGLNPKVASVMDPQQRLFLESAWEVLEQTGYLPKHYDGSIGVYAGTGMNTYYLNNVIPNRELLNQVGDLQASSLNEKDYIATRTAYHLNLKGPAVSVHSACSTSLLAIAQAVEAIRNGQCDVAIAGASSVTAPIYSGHLYQEGSIMSPDGHCRSFDAEAKGTVFSDGCGVVLLKSLEAAKKDGDYIYGTIKGIGINNDGGEKGSFTAPSVEGQSEAIFRALNDANISPSDISYIETHGTATPIGDPIEIEGLQEAFGEQSQKGYCAIGSIKSNMGHLTAAAGVAGFIKTILALNHRQLPPSLGFSEPNPAIDFANSPFFVNTILRDWESKNVRRAGISSFGVGGTNVHIVVEEAETKQITSGDSKPLQILTWSAKTDNSLEGYKIALGNYIKSSTELNLADVAYSLSATRDTFNKRSFVLATDSENAIDQLLLDGSTSVKNSDLKAVPSNLAFLFPGQGAQYLQMGKALYEHEEVFQKAVNQCAELLQEAYNYDIRTIIYPESNSQEAEDRLKDTQYTQPALFVVEYALSQLWMSWGIQPTMLCGHSIGEFVAAHLAGIFTLKDALLLVAVRGKLVSDLPGGSMLSVRTTFENLSEILPETLCVAAVNSDQLCVVSGEDKDIEEFAKLLEEKEIPNRLLLTSHAFHSTMMDPVLEEFESEVSKLSLSIPRIPIVSTVTGTWLSDSEATNPKYWSDHLRATVRFSDAMETALGLEDIVLLEIGPGRALTTLSQQKKKTKSASSIATLVVPDENENSYHTVLSALGQLWLKGIEPDWSAFYEGQSRQKVLLPSYVFDRKHCWVDPPLTETSTINFNTQTESNLNQPIQTQMNTALQPNRKAILLEKISDIVMNTSGMELESSEHDQNFLELGLDSLVLTQMAITCKNEFKIPITFRQLNGEFSTPNLLATYLDDNLPKEIFAPEPLQIPVQQTVHHNNPSLVSQPNVTSNNNNNNNNNIDNSAIGLIAQQLQLLGKQLDLLQGNVSSQPFQVQSQNANPIPFSLDQMNGTYKTPLTNSDDTSEDSLTEEEKKELKKPFGASPRIEKSSTGLNKQQKSFIDKLTFSYNKKTAGSKAYTQKHRPHMSDPRVVSGFKPFTKELVYPIVVEKSSGNRLWDIDGNEYIDTLNGFGSSLFGHQPEFITKVLHEQIESGYEVGPQHPLAGEVCELLCEFTGLERAALCNTGSEAVLGAMRIARTVTGRSLIVAFSGAYHGINDEGLVRGSKKLKTFPASAGILGNSVQNVLILEYGTDESLEIIRNRSHELAAVIVEPVQSRRPEFQPVEFLKEIRKITKATDTAFIFDEVITGFRIHPGGAQALFGIKADLATYGKVIGGGISIGAIVGSKTYMDALDGGFWQYGDDSYPEIGVTYFAGTFVRHPLALAASKASLLHMKEKGESLQRDLNLLTENYAKDLNREFAKRSLPMEINYFGSLWRLKILEDIPYAELLFVMMREKGIHVWDGFPCFMTTAYKMEDIHTLKNTFISCVDELISAGILNSHQNDTVINHTESPIEALNKPPVPGARLGMDQLGNPAWFVEDSKEKGNFVKIEL